ncbi:MAG: hypothetical protein RIF33_20295 [Cyclobacteriaceae bacterium]
MRAFFLLMLAVNFGCGFVQKPAPRIEVVIPTANQEADYVWRTLQDMRFFDERGYDVSLPTGNLIETLKKKSLDNQLSQGDFKSLKKFIRDSVYSSSAYQSGYKKAEKGALQVENMLSKILESPRNWEFKVFSKYQVLLTLYGPGGSYDPDEGTVLLFTTADGQFKQYTDPANTLIHEITHIGMEASIMAPFDVPHGLKERIVDTFVHLNFQDQLPEYRIQQMGDERFGEYVRTREQLSELRSIVESFMRQ